MSNLADVGTPLRISVRPGFRDVDAVAPFAPLYGALYNTDVTPELYRLYTRYIGPENETTTGPNFARRLQVEVDIAKGQTLSNVQIFDTLSSSMQILGRNTNIVVGSPKMAVYLNSSGPANVFDPSRLTGTAQPTSPGGTLNYNFGTLTGVDGGDATFEFNFYVPRDNASPPGGQILPQTATTGTDSLGVGHSVFSTANWNPLDTRDPQNQSVSAPSGGGSVNQSFETQSIAAQKSVEAIDPTGVAVTGIVPGRTLLRYTINFQVSDYYAFENVVLRDVMSDGQRLFIGTRGSVNAFPTLSVNNAYLTGATVGSRVNTSGNFQGAGVIDYRRRYSVGNALADPTSFPADGPALGTVSPSVFTNLAPQPDTDRTSGGGTYLQFDVSKELKARLGANAGRLVGGEIGNDGSGPRNSVFGNQEFTGTRGTLVFYAEVREEFSDAYPSNDDSVDQGDVLSNSLNDPTTGDRDGILGAQLRPATINAASATVIGTGTDDSAAVAVIQRGTVEKQVFAVNGQVLPPQNGFDDAVTVQAGDRVTFRLTYGLPLSSFEDLHLVDIAPLPVFRALNSGPFTFVRNPAAYSYQAGQVGVFDPAGSNPLDDTYFATFDPSMTGVRNPTITVNDTNNELSINFGTWDDIPARRTTQISVLVTFVVSNDPFVNDLFLTNQLRITEESTNAGMQTEERIRQFELVRPFVSVNKGVVAANNAGLTNGNIVFAPASDPTGRFTIGGGALSAANSLSTSAQASAIGALDINPVNAPVDAGDKVRYAIVVQNTGRGDAFDVDISDKIQPGFVIPGSFAGLNFRGFRGDGTTLNLNTDYTLASYNSTTGAFQVQLTDNYTAGNVGGPALDARSGALSRSIGNGSNTVIFLYDLQLADSVAPNSSIINTASVTKYSNAEGGPDYTDPSSTPTSQTTEVLPQSGDPFDTANTLVINPGIVKTLTATDLTTEGNASNQATIGELATYTVTVTVPEGVMPNASIKDTMQSGLAFVRLMSVTSSNPTELTYSNSFVALPNSLPSNVAVTSSGQIVEFNFGTITNTNRNNATAETFTLVYEAVVLNTANNQAGETRTNSAQISWQNNATTVAAAAAAPITLVEPTLATNKLVRNVTRSGSFAASASGDASDVIEYQITISNGNAATDTRAFDVTLADALPAMILSPSLVSATSTGGVLINGVAGTVGLGDLQLVGSTLSFAKNIDMPKNSSIIIVVQGQLLGGFAAPTDNVASTQWTSLDGVVANRSTHNSASGERTGAGGVNDFISQGTATVDSPPLVHKRVVATSEPHTTGSSVAVGEIVRYRIATTVPEGASSNVVLQDLLPTGMRFLNDGSARYAFISTSGLSIASAGVANVAGLGTAGGLAGNQASIAGLDSTTVVGVFGDNNISGAVLGAGTGDAPLYNPSDSVFFRFGDLSNSDNDLDSEFLVVEFNALVANVTGNQAGGSLSNTFAVLADFDANGAPGYLSVIADANGNGVRDTGENPTAASDADNNATTAPNTIAASNAVGVTVVEPALTIDKQAIATTGAVVTYRVTVANLTGANISQAIDTRVIDTLDGVNLSLVAGSVTAPVLAGGATGAADNSSGNVVDVYVAAMPPGATATFTYQANVLTTPSGATTLDNTAVATFTSTPGVSGAGGTWTGVTATSSTVPGASGAANGERIGADGAGLLNDYRAVDTERLGSLGDRVWVDLNNNGVQDSGEPGIVNVPLTVRWAGRNGVFNDGDDSSTTPNPRTQDFGYRGPGTTGDRVFLDVDNDGAYDSGEGIANATVRLTGDFDGDGATETVSATTNTDGFYSFSGLRVTAGGVAYSVSVVAASLPAGVNPFVRSRRPA